MAYVDVPGDGEETFVLMHGEPGLPLPEADTDPGRARPRGRAGHARSDKYTDPDAYSVELHYESFETLVFDALELTDVTLVCPDWGGILGLALAGHHPERFARLVPMNTGVPDGTQEMSDAWHRFPTSSSPSRRSRSRCSSRTRRRRS